MCLSAVTQDTMFLNSLLDDPYLDLQLSSRQNQNLSLSQQVRHTHTDTDTDSWLEAFHRFNPVPFMSSVVQSGLS